MRITSIRHPEYRDLVTDWDKYRYCYRGGRDFIDRYLKQYSKREDALDFQMRKSISYAPTFAKAALNKIKNSIYQRMAEISRVGGPQTYQSAARGENGGVDLYGSSMNRFIGQFVLQELISMGKVGIWLDKEPTQGPLIIDNKDKSPYVYLYKAEDICSWTWGTLDGEQVYVNVLLRDTDYTFDQATGLNAAITECYRHVWIHEDGFVHIQRWVANDDPKVASDEQGQAVDIKLGEEIVLTLKRIPFISLSLQDSLLVDVADYQIALLNLASSDLNYTLKANFPFYTEQFDPRSENVFGRRPPQPLNANARMNSDDSGETGGTASESRRADREEIQVGSLTGRRYPAGLETPAFIAPPTEPLEASMKKQEQMKAEIYALVNIAVTQAEPQHASADSKSMDDRSLEAGLAYIGLELEWAERQIGEIWCLYESGKAPTINYPAKYSLKTESERRDEAEKLFEMMGAAPSKQYAKEIAKQIAHLLLCGKVENGVIESIAKEIDAAKWLTSNIEDIATALEAGIVDAVTASNAAGFEGEKVVPKAQEEHAERLKLISESQADGAARGVPDKAGKKGDAKLEKKDSQKNRDKKSNPAKTGTRGKA